MILLMYLKFERIIIYIFFGNFRFKCVMCKEEFDCYRIDQNEKLNLVKAMQCALCYNTRNSNS